MGWTLTSVAARVLRPLGWGRRWVAPDAVRHAKRLAADPPAVPGGAHDLPERAWERRLAQAPPADRKALEAAAAELGADARVIERAAGTGAPVAAVAALAAAWETLPSDAKAAARDPLAAPSGRREEGPAAVGVLTLRQIDETTCGAAVLAMVALTTDPFVAVWLATGRVFADHRPAAVAGVIGDDWRSAPRSLDARWAALQRALHAEATRGGLGPFPWPRALGTPPWGLARMVRPFGVRYRGASLDDRSPDAAAAWVVHASAALADSLPVPLYSAGDSGLGLGTAVPRHVILLVARIDDGFLAYEPSRGVMMRLPDAAFTGPGPRRAALGHWSRVAWLVLPSPVH